MTIAVYKKEEREEKEKWSNEEKKKKHFQNTWERHFIKRLQTVKKSEAAIN